MSGRGPSAFGLLSAREHDCLRLLTKGLGITEASVYLGISVSTLNKHLSSARKKLGAARTTQALLTYQCRHRNFRQHSALQRDAVDGAASYSVILCDFVAALEGCSSFDDAWDVHMDYVGRMGVKHVYFGLVAEPPGQFANGSQMIRMNLPGSVIQLYAEAGGVTADPFIAMVAMSRYSSLHDLEAFIESHADEMSMVMRRFGDAILDHDCRYLMHQPEQDSMTGAPFALVYTLDPHLGNEFRQGARQLKSTLKLFAYFFCDFLQKKNLLASFSGLTNRQREALTFAARGFRTPEMADQMGISVRAVEKILAGARKQLGVRTTSAAIYRAMVFRTLA